MRVVISILKEFYDDGAEMIKVQITGEFTTDEEARTFLVKQASVFGLPISGPVRVQMEVPISDPDQPMRDVTKAARQIVESGTTEKANGKPENEKKTESKPEAKKPDTKLDAKLDMAKFARLTTLRAVVNELHTNGGFKTPEEILTQCRALKDAGASPPFAIIPATELEDRVLTACAAMKIA